VDAAVFVVWRQGEEDHPCACAFAGFGEGRFGLHEVGALRGDDEALPMLLSAVAERAGGRGSKGRLCLPREQPIDAALAVLFDDLEQPIDDEPMARAIAPDFDGHRIDALFAAPGAFTWMLDDF
jgi:hypothetical protein